MVERFATNGKPLVERLTTNGEPLVERLTTNGDESFGDVVPDRLGASNFPLHTTQNPVKIAPLKCGIGTLWQPDPFETADVVKLVDTLS